MLAYHPTFTFYPKKVVISTNGQDITIPEIMEIGSRTLQVPKRISSR